jgi:predicted TIM-barrel fold metal-dependent hydrolase|tara:strand:- start:1386 stop:2273 length:888 start_codon:yes stop_codon:yes gene_type:complete
MVIDSHQHVFWHGRNDIDLINDMDINEIDQSWLLTWEIPPDQDDRSYHSILNPIHIRSDGSHSGIPLSDLIIARDRAPERFILGYCPNPSLDSAPELFEVAVKMYDVKVCGEWKFRVLIDNPSSIKLFNKAGEHNCPVILHLDVPWIMNQKGRRVYQKNWYGGNIHNLESVLLACPQVNFIGHGPGFWREISADSSEDSDIYPKGPVIEGGEIHRIFNKYDNLYADLSAGSALNAIKRDMVHAKNFIHEFSDRLLFGRDYFGSELIDILNELDLSTAIREKIFSGTAKKLLGENN